MTLQRTPLYENHLKCGGKMVPFAGWEMPVQYPKGLIAEHQAVRSNVGMFDVSHMGEIFVSGPMALPLLQRITCNDVSKLSPGKAHYSAFLNSKGGVIDDIIIYQLSNDNYLICVNASNSDKDFEWINAQNREKAEVKNASSEFGQIAIQGPNSKVVLSKLFGEKIISELKYFEITETTWNDVKIIIARTGYTGEDGAEVFIPWKDTSMLWNALLENGVEPCGLGARDTLRLEACYPLHGHELSESITAIESGLGWVVKVDKGEFIGREIVATQKASTPPKSLIGFFVEDPGIVREGAPIKDSSGNDVGVVTSGTKTPTINKALGMAIVNTNFKAPETTLFAEVRGKLIKIKTAKIPFYKTSTPPPR